MTSINIVKNISICEGSECFSDGHNNVPPAANPADFVTGRMLYVRSHTEFLGLL